MRASHFDLLQAICIQTRTPSQTFARRSRPAAGRNSGRTAGQPAQQGVELFTLGEQADQGAAHLPDRLVLNDEIALRKWSGENQGGPRVPPVSLQDLPAAAGEGCLVGLAFNLRRRPTRCQAQGVGKARACFSVPAVC